MDFILAASRLFADTMRIPDSEITTDAKHVKQILSTVDVPPFTPKSNKVKVKKTPVEQSSNRSSLVTKAKYYTCHDS